MSRRSDFHLPCTAVDLMEIFPRALSFPFYIFIAQKRSANKSQVALAFMLSALVFFLWRCRKKRGDQNGTRIQSPVSLDNIKSPEFMKAELDSNPIPHSPALSELQSFREAAEMPVPHFVAELPGSMPPGYSDSNIVCATPTSQVSALTSETGSGPSPTEREGHVRRRSTIKGIPSRSSLPVSPVTPERRINPT